MAKNYGTYHVNPAGKKSRGRKKSAQRRRRLKNPFGIVLVNPAKKRGGKRAKSARRAKRAARRITVRRKSVLSASVQTKNPMKTRRRGRRRHRNPSRRRNRRRSSVVVIRNPARGRGRRRSRRMRNPVSGVVGDVFNSNTLTLGAGIVTAQVGTTLILNKIRASQMAAGGQLPGLRPGQESAMGIMIYKLLIGAGVGYLLRNQAPRFSQGLILGAVSGAISDLVMQSRVLQTAGVGRNFGARPGTGAYLPGTPTRFTGPASQFLANGVPRPGMGAAVRPGFVRQTENLSEGAFRGAN